MTATPESPRKTLGEISFDTGAHVLQWNELDANGKQHWENSAKAVADAIIERHIAPFYESCMKHEIIDAIRAEFK